MLNKLSIPLEVEWQDVVEQLVTVSPDTSLIEAIALMNECNTSCVAVEKAGKLQGIFTERDLVKLVAAKQDLGVAIANVIERSPVTVSTEAKVELSELVCLLQEHSIAHLPVLDGERIVGIISERSLNHALCKSDRQLEEILCTVRDIEESFEVGDRFLSEVQLRDSEAKYRAIFEQAAVGIVQTGTDKRLLRVNPKFCQMLGYAAEELQQLTFTDITYAKDRQSDDNDLERFLAGEIATLVKEKRYVHRDGSIFWVKVTVALVNDTDSDYFIAIIEDINERKQAELALKESETRFYDMVNSFPFPVWVSDETGTCSFFNRAWLDFTGKTLEQELGRGWLASVHPDDISRCQDNCKTVSQTQRSYKIEYRLQRYDGSYCWLLNEAKPRFKPDGSFAGFVGSCIDIDDRVTAKIEREQLLQSIEQKKQFLEAVLQQMPAGVIIASAPDGKIVLSNSQVEPILRHPLIEIDKIEDYTQYGCLYPNGQLRKAEDYSIVKALNGKTTAGEESQYLGGDGSIRTIFINAAPIFDSKSQIVAAVATFYDVTELKQTQAIAKDVEHKALMLKEVNHRIKNNLQIVSALLDLQTEQITTPEIIDLLEESQARIQTIALMHEQLYTSEAGDRIKISDYIKSLALFLQKSLVPHKKHINIIYDLEPIEIDIDRAISCGLIINELVTNSLKHGFTTKASGTIKICLHRSANNSICLVVHDNGTGMAEIEIDNIQSLGLSLVNSLVTTQLDGSWSIQSSDRTIIQIKIPLT